MRLSVLIASIVAVSVPARADDRAISVGHYAHTAWTPRGGAFRGYPKSLAQTADGYLWLGTDFGVVRFDGVRFVEWEGLGGGPLPSTTVLRLLATRDGSLWIGTTKGLARWKDRQLTRYAEVAGHYVTALVERRDGTVWVATSRGPGPTAQLCAIQPTVRCTDDGRLGRFVTSLFEDWRGTFWVSASTGLWRWAPGEQKPQSTAQAAAEIAALAEDEQGSLVIAANRGVHRLGPLGLEPYGPIGARHQVKATTLLRDRYGSMWIGTQQDGLLLVHNGRVDQFSRQDGLSAEFVTAFLEDREENVWVGTLRGLHRLRAVAVTALGTRQGLSTNIVLSVLAARDGTVWLGTVGGLHRWKEGRITGDGVPPSLRREAVGSLFEDGRGRVWVSSPRGLVHFEAGRSAATSALRHGHVHAIVEGRSENLWVSDQERGLLRLRQGQVVESFPWSHFDGRRARVLATDAGSGGLWLGFFAGGVAYFNDGRVQALYTESEGLTHAGINHLRVAPDGAVWVAGEAGLSRIRGGVITTLTRGNGLPCDNVRWTMQDDEQALWIYTACALVRLNRAEVDAWIANPRHRVRVTVYDAADGVPIDVNVSSYSPSVTKAADGRVWFASYDGASVLDPRELRMNVVMPPVHIEQITIDGNTYEPSSVARLQPHVRDLRIDYSALSLSAPEKVRFRYRLEGRDHDWVEAGTRRQVFYTDLSPGTYRFRVIAANNHGVWNEKGAAWTVIAEPAFYQTTSFKAAYALVALIACWALYRARMAHLANQLKVRFEERLAERTRIAQELHDTVLQGVLSTSMQLHVLAEQVSDEGVRSRLDHVLERLRRVNGEGRETLQALRALPATAEDLDVALGRDAEDFRGDRPIDIRVVVEGKREPLHPLIRDDLYRIGREALANTFRHSGARTVEIQLEYSADRFRLCVGDDGCGLAPDVVETKLSGHWGILGMRERAERIGAKLRLFSAPGLGTEIELVVRAHLAFQRPVARRRLGWLRRIRAKRQVKQLQPREPVQPSSV